MSDYLFIESRNPFESADLSFGFELASNLARNGHRVTVFLVQNGVMPARAKARSEQLHRLKNAGVAVLADDHSLRERGIGPDELVPGVSPSPLETVIDELSGGAKALWH